MVTRILDRKKNYFLRETKLAIFIKTLKFCTFSNGDNLHTHDEKPRVFGIDC